MNRIFLILKNQKSQTHLDSSLSTLSTIDLTLIDTSIFIDCNWRVYEDSFNNDHYPIIMENTIIENSEPQRITKSLRWNFRKAIWQSYKKLCFTTLIPESNINQEESIIHFTNTLNSQQKYPPNHNIPKTQLTMVHRSVQRHKGTWSNPQEIQNKYKQQRAKTWHTIKETKRSSWRTFTSKINFNTNYKIIWNFISNKNINSPISHLSQGNKNAISEKHIANLITENFAQASFTKKLLQSIQLGQNQRRKEWNKIHLWQYWKL